MSYFVSASPAGLGLSIDGSFRLGAALAQPCQAPPVPLSPPVAASGLGLTLSLPSGASSQSLVDQITGAFNAAVNANVDAAVDQAMARIPTTPQYLAARNALLGLLALQAAVVLVGMYFIEKDFGRK